MGIENPVNDMVVSPSHGMVSQDQHQVGDQVGVLEARFSFCDAHQSKRRHFTSGILSLSHRTNFAFLYVTPFPNIAGAIAFRSNREARHLMYHGSRSQLSGNRDCRY